jgi:O-antigen ligase
VRALAVRTLSWTVFATLLTIIVLLPIPYGAVQAWWISLFEVVVFTITILWIIEGLLSGKGIVKEHEVLLPLLLIVLFALTQTVPLSSSMVGGVSITRTISADPFETRQFTVKLLAHTLVLAMLIRFTNTRSRLRILTYAIVASGTGIAVFGLLRFVLQPQQGGFLLHYLKGETGFGPFINRDHFSFLMEITMGLIAGLAIFGGFGKWKLRLFFGFGLIIWLATSLSGSRGGVSAMVCQIMLGFFLAMSDSSQILRSPFARILRRAYRSLTVRAVALAVILIVIVATSIWIGGDKFRSSLEMVPSEIGINPSADSVQRADIWQAGWQLFKAHPIVGTGFGGFSAAITRYHEKSGIYAIRQAHNDYLEILTSGGLIAVALGIWFVYGVYRVVSDRLRTESGFMLAARWGAVIAFFGVAIHSFVDFGLHVPGNSIALMAVLAISLVDVSRKRVKRTGRRLGSS